jgi:hypothetical protein
MAGAPRRRERATRSWRRDAIAAKHAHESSGDPFDGHLAVGVAHATLPYATDPRTDLPDELSGRIRSGVTGLDPTIVRGWLEAADA